MLWITSAVAENVYTLPPKGREAAIARLVPILSVFQAGKPVNVKLTIARPERTPPQLRYLWGVPIKMLAEHGGYEPEEVHEYLCGSFWGWRDRKLPGGRMDQKPIRTTTVDADGNRDVIDGDEFWKYVEFIQRVGARAGVVIPDPQPETVSAK